MNNPIFMVSPFVPQKFKTKEFWFEAVKQNGKALYYVPDELRDKVRGRLVGA